MVYVDGIWHRMPIPYPGNFMVPEPQFFFSPPPPSLENVFDYNNAIFVEDDLPEQPTQDNGHGLKRLTSAEITEEDLAFLKSKAKVLSNLEEPSPPISLKSNFSPSTYSSPSN
uniref:Uncharacterized protein n=1 Tax=Panagrolaimus sp. ES5 TaxID=591445 RepID=A0AC34G2J1_9BILA